MNDFVSRSFELAQLNAVLLKCLPAEMAPFASIESRLTEFDWLDAVNGLAMLGNRKPMIHVRLLALLHDKYCKYLEYLEPMAGDGASMRRVARALKSAWRLGSRSPDRPASDSAQPAGETALSRSRSRPGLS